LQGAGRVVLHHDALRLGTLNSILSDVASQLGMTRDELATELFGKS
jgi:hypothetical protein